MPSTNFMFTGTSTFSTSAPYWSLVNSSMLRVTMSGFFFANASDFSSTTVLVADQLEEERDVVGAALVADPLDPRVLEVVDAAGSDGA